MNSFSFTLSGKLFICPSILSDSFAGQSNLGGRSLLSITLNTSCQSLLACKVSFEKSADSLTGIPLQVTNFFSFAAFKILSLSLNLLHFNFDVSWCGPLRVQLVWDSLCFLNLHVYFLHQIREVFFIIFSNKFSVSCSSSLAGIPIIQVLLHLEMSQRFLILSWFL